ncbi:hypothetical protein GCM10018781_37810 [Kitasatospora indigofera]|uniref:Uncharacterized protein n=1 Tax=Kitasatospora indigofera TaxID=67307 RepID=A0A919FWZ6_9ACTN|nr:hypothetical protein [Kitasatospora indigofera]GHH73444.1 hypothetical protein GCM10018781_37810 [Kitasatospora indigofera]
MTAQYRALAWAGAILGALTAVGLVVYAMVGDLETADRVASVLGAVVGLAALVVSLFSLRTPAAPATGAPRVRIDRTVNADGNIRGRVRTGDEGPAAAAPAQAAPAQDPGVTVTRSVVAGGDITGTVITGDTRPGNPPGPTP